MEEQNQPQAGNDKDALYKAAVDVINQALAELDETEPLDKGGEQMLNEDPDGQRDQVIDPMAEGAGVAQDVSAAPAAEEPAPAGEPVGKVAEEAAPEEEKEPEEDEDESDEDVEKIFKAYEEKMKKRGLSKTDPKQSQPLTKTQPAAKPAAKAESKPEIETLRKTYDDKFEQLTKTIETLTAQVTKLADRPVGRKGVTGVRPLAKNDGADLPEGAGAPAQETPLTKSQIVDKLIDLQKSGNPEVTPLFVTKVETGGLDRHDIEKVRRLLGQ